MNAGEISELSRNVICSGFEKSRSGLTRYRFELGCAVYNVHDPARVDANTTLPSGAKTGSKLCTRTLLARRPPSLVSWRQVPPATSSSQRSRPLVALGRAAKITLVPS